MKNFKLFCFPYAGGSASLYKKWKPKLNSNIDLHPIELAGRGMRINDNFYTNGQELIEDVFKIIHKEIDVSEYCFFGHSLGCMIAYELAQKVRDHRLREPTQIFFSGRGAPHISRIDEKKYHLMNDIDFKSNLIKLGGTPPEIFDYPELVDLFIPLLKNDFKLSETPIHHGPIRPLDYDITVFLGKNDNLTTAQCDEWRFHTNQKCQIHYFDGGHFFIHDYFEDIIKVMNQTLTTQTSSNASKAVVEIDAYEK